MLRHLSIRNYALIETLEIDFDRELNIITGETGSGKSILLGALGLILGERAETRVVQSGKKKCYVEGHFEFSSERAKPLFEKHDLDFEDTTIVRREILSSGKSRAFINDSPVTLTVLKEVGGTLVDIHSQHQTIQVNDPSFQLQVLDSFASSATELFEYRRIFFQFKQKEKRLEALKAAQLQQINEDDYLRFQLDELEKADLDQFDEEALETEYATLANADVIGSTLAAAADLLTTGESPITTSLKRVNDLLGEISAYSKLYADLADRLKITLIELDDIGSEVDAKISEVEADPRRLEVLEELRSIVFRLEQKHQVSSVAELLKIQTDITQRLEAKNTQEAELKDLHTDLSGLRKELDVAGKLLTSKRKDATHSFAKGIVQILRKLNMNHAAFQVDLNHSSIPTENGFDGVEMLFSANLGQKPDILRKVASGGELSRLMLAIKKNSIGIHSKETIVFDEIDSGVSGEVANMMGSIIKQMAVDVQTICITHLPQIASQGQAHYKVYKEEKSNKVETKIEKLDSEERIAEIAQMLSGKYTTEAALKNARELLMLS